MLNFKGGVAKTTSVCALAQLTALSGKKVLFIDTDPQCNATWIFGIQNIAIDYEKRERMFCSELKSLHEMQELIYATNFSGIDIIPSGDELSDIANAVYDKSKECNVDVFLRHNLQLLSDIYDYVFIDTSPFRNNLTRCSVAAANRILTPVEVDNFSYGGLTKLIDLISEISIKYSIDTKLEGIFFTRYNERTVLARQMKESYQSVFGDYFIPLGIRDCVTAKEANTQFQPLWNYDKGCTTMQDYVQLANYLGLIEGTAYRKILKDLYA